MKTNKILMFVLLPLAIIQFVLISLVIMQFSFANDTQEKKIENFINCLNNGSAATMYNISFSCINPKSDKPILITKAVNMCLECEDCNIRMGTFLAESFLLISNIWFQEFGSYKMNIVNRDDKIVFIIDDKHRLIKYLQLKRNHA